MSEMAFPSWPWPEVPEIVAHTVESRLFSELGVGKVFILIDPIGGSDSMEWLADAPRYALDARILRQSEERVPFLVELPNRHDSRLMASVHAALLEQIKLYRHGRGILRLGGWLQHAEQDGHRLSKQLTGLFLLQRPFWGVSNVRLADRRVLAMLHQGAQQRPPAPVAIPGADWPSLLGDSVPCWAYLDGNFKIHSLRGKPGTAMASRLSFPLELWQLLGRSTLLAELSARWHARQYPIPDDALFHILRELRKVEQDHPDWPQERRIGYVEARLVARPLRATTYQGLSNGDH